MSFGILRWQDVQNWYRQGQNLLAVLAPAPSSGPLVRGTIYDRHLRELAVSYARASVHAQPYLVRDVMATAGRIAALLGIEAEPLQLWLREGGALIVPPGVLTPEKIADLEHMDLAGIEVRSAEERYYPQQAMAAQALGYVEDNFGLTGVEGRYDTVLQPGVYRSSEMPQLDCLGRETPGALGSDLVLTLDREMQRVLEATVSERGRESGMLRGGALLMEVETGALLAMASVPAFDLNRAWRVDEQQRQNVLLEPLVPEGALRMLLQHAVRGLGGQGEDDGEALPPLVAAMPHAAQDRDVLRVADMIGLYDTYSCDLPPQGEERPEHSARPSGLTSASSLQLATAMARLVNNGSPVEPHLLAGVYDRSDRRYFLRRKRQPASLAYIRTLAPRETSRVAREFAQQDKGQAVALQTLSVPTLSLGEKGGVSQQRTLDLTLALVPAKAPRLLLLALCERPALLPAPRNQPPAGSLAPTLRTLALRFHAMARPVDLSSPPPPRDPATYAVYLAEQRGQRRDDRGVAGRGNAKAAAREETQRMPSVEQMSLRRGLRQLAGHNLVIRISGSGRIVSQQPPAGTRLEGVTECLLVLRPEV